MKINERSKLIINKLISANDFITAKEIANELGVSLKTITRQLADVEKILDSHNLYLERKTSKGMRLIGSRQEQLKLLELLEVKNQHEYTPIERQNIILSHLLKSQEPIKLLGLARLLNVTEATISNDLDKIEPKLKDMNINMIRRPGLGIYLEGLEKDIRKAIISHIYESLHSGNILEVLQKSSKNRIKTDADKFLLDLVDKNIIHKVEKAVEQSLKDKKYLLNNDFSGLIVHLTLAVQRLLNGDIIKIDGQFLKKLEATAEFKTAEGISKNINNAFNLEVPKEEIAYITMHLLGSRNLYQEGLVVKYDNFLLIKIAKEMITIAELKANLVIVKKSKLLIGLVKHLGPAVTRMKLNMEIRNPLLKEMKEKYPQWMSIAKEAIKPLEKAFKIFLPEAEIAYIAMHLGSAMEDVKLINEQYNILVACPTGIGTSKLLASQIKAKFSNLQIKGIISAVNIDYAFYKKENVDFIISTVEIDEPKIPTIVVNFMLNDIDINKIRRQMSFIEKRQETEFVKNSSGIRLSKKIDIMNCYGNCIKSILDNFIYWDNVDIKNANFLCEFVSFNVINSDSAVLNRALKERENKGSTVVDHLMILHTKSKVVKEPFIGVIKLKSSIEVDEYSVKSVLVLLVNDKADKEILSTIGYIPENIIENTNLLELFYEGSKEEILLELEKIYTKFIKERYLEIMEG